jgi:hypothetical protein
VLQGLAHIHKACIGAVYEHWCKKRLKVKRPLLQRLWFEHPWVQVRDAGKEARPGAHKGSDSDLPFMGQDAPRAPVTRPRRMNAQEALYKLESIRWLSQSLGEPHMRHREIRHLLHFVELKLSMCRMENKI